MDGVTVVSRATRENAQRNYSTVRSMREGCHCYLAKWDTLSIAHTQTKAESAQLFLQLENIGDVQDVYLISCPVQR